MDFDILISHLASKIKTADRKCTWAMMVMLWCLHTLIAQCVGQQVASFWWPTTFTWWKGWSLRRRNTVLGTFSWSSTRICNITKLTFPFRLSTFHFPIWTMDYMSVYCANAHLIPMELTKFLVRFEFDCYVIHCKIVWTCYVHHPFIDFEVPSI